MNTILNNSNDNCGCDAPADILPNNNINNQNINNMNMNMNMNNQKVNNMNNINNMNNPKVNNINNNNMNNQNINNMIEMDNKEIDNKNTKFKDNIKLILSFLVALALNEMIKFFINQSIRLNKGTSARYIYYPIFIIILFVIFGMY